MGVAWKDVIIFIVLLIHVLIYLLAFKPIPDKK